MCIRDRHQALIEFEVEDLEAQRLCGAQFTVVARQADAVGRLLPQGPLRRGQGMVSVGEHRHGGDPCSIGDAWVVGASRCALHRRAL